MFCGMKKISIKPLGQYNFRNYVPRKWAGPERLDIGPDPSLKITSPIGNLMVEHK